MPPERTIFLIDGQSFYASVEKAAHPEYAGKPVAVGDPMRPSGIILAACPIAKARGVTTAERNFTALAKCPDLVIIRPRMQRYIQVSLAIKSRRSEMSLNRSATAKLSVPACTPNERILSSCFRNW